MVTTHRSVCPTRRGGRRLAYAAACAAGGVLLGVPGHFASALFPDAAHAVNLVSAGGMGIDESFRERLQEVYGALPLSFEANHGQADPDVQFTARSGGYTLSLTPHAAVVMLPGAAGDTSARGAGTTLPATPPAVLRLTLVGADDARAMRGEQPLSGKSHYVIGADPRQWRTDVTHFGKVRYEDVYPDVDLVYYGTNGHLEYDFVIGPGADPGAIALAFEGADQMRIDANGDLTLAVGSHEIRQRKPVLYQELGGVRAAVAGGYRLEGQLVKFDVGAYDARQTLVIDPVLIYATHVDAGSGGPGLADSSERDSRIAVDREGNAYVAAQVTTHGSPFDIFVAKINTRGNALVYTTLIAGSFSDSPSDIAVDDWGHVYLTGTTESHNFPTTPGAFQPELGDIPAFPSSTNVFVLKLDRTGSHLVYSTYLAGSSRDIASGIAVDARGYAYVTGQTQSPDFPVTSQAFPMQCRPEERARPDGDDQGAREPHGRGHDARPGPPRVRRPAPCLRGVDAFITKLSRDGSRLVYSTFLGGSGSDEGNGIDVDARGSAYITGSTGSSDFPTHHGAFQKGPGGTGDAFVAKLNRRGTALVYSTYLGGSSADSGHGIAVDTRGFSYVIGRTQSGDFPRTPGAFQLSLAGPSDHFVTKLDRTGSSLVYSTYLGGSDDVPSLSGASRDPRASRTDIAVDAKGHAHVTGDTRAVDFPTTVGALQPNPAGGADAFVATFSRDGASLVYSSHIGGALDDFGSGIAVDDRGNVYATGMTLSDDFPTTPDAVQPTRLDGIDLFVVKIGEERRKKAVR